MRKKVLGFQSDGSIERNEEEIFSDLSDEQKGKFSSYYLDRSSRKIRSAIKEADLVHLHNPLVEGYGGQKEKRNHV